MQNYTHSNGKGHEVSPKYKAVVFEAHVYKLGVLLQRVAGVHGENLRLAIGGSMYSRTVWMSMHVILCIFM